MRTRTSKLYLKKKGNQKIEQSKTEQVELKEMTVPELKDKKIGCNCYQR